MKTDVRWQQRFQNFCAALKLLERCINHGKKQRFNEMEELALIQSFEITYELAWNCMKDYCQSFFSIEIGGSKDAIFHAFNNKLIDDGKIWLEMVVDRIQTVHAYNEKIAHHIAGAIVKKYYSEFLKLEKKLSTLKEKS